MLMNIPVRRTATLVLLLLAVLPAFAGNTAGAQKPIAVQMYTLRNAGPLDQQLKIVHDAGVRAVETVGTQNASAAELKQLLDRYSIKAVSSHVQLAELRDNLDAVVAFNRSIGNSTLVVPYLDQKDRPRDAAGWTALGRELGRIARQVRGRGMQLAYHNHDFELVDEDRIVFNIDWRQNAISENGLLDNDENNRLLDDKTFSFGFRIRPIDFD